MRGGKILDRREFFWEELPEIAVPEPAEDEVIAVKENAGSPSSTPQNNKNIGPQAVLSVNDKDSGPQAPSPAHDELEEQTLSSGKVQLSSRENLNAQEQAFSAESQPPPAKNQGSYQGTTSVVPLAPQENRALAPASLFSPGAFFSALMKQVYIDQQYVPRDILSPVEFEDRTELEELLSEKRGSKVEILVPQRGEKRSLIDLAAQNAKQSFDQRFRVMKPQAKAVQEALQDALGLPEIPKRIECFDISHIQGAETVASMVVWEDGAMNKNAYRKFIVKTVTGVDDFASMREVVGRRYKRLRDENKPFPSLVLIDGGLGQLHAAAQSLEELGITNQPLAAIAKKEEIIYVFGQEDDPVVLERHSPVLHLVQMVRDESHRFAVTFHRKRRQMRDRKSELLEIPGVGELTRQRLLQHFGSVRAVQQADAAALGAVLTKPQTEAVLKHFQKTSQ
jgi:excinuclease ABC subunit C